MTTFVEVVFITATWASTEEPAVIGEPVHLYVFFHRGGGRRDDQQAESYEKWQVDAVQRTGVLGLLRIGSIKLMRNKYIPWRYSRKGGWLMVDVKPIRSWLFFATCLLLFDRIAVKLRRMWLRFLFVFDSCE